MNQVEALKTLEGLLENFLERVVKLKYNQLQTLGGINRLDDIARRMDINVDFTEEIGNWFARHNSWLEENRFREVEENRLQTILEEICKKMSDREFPSPAENKIRAEIDRWSRTLKESRKIILKKPPETPRIPEPVHPAPVAQSARSDNDIPASIARFDYTLKRLAAIFSEMSISRAHLLSVLDDSLKKAETQKNKEALILSALIIYYLKQDRYKVGPYVKRLKETERSFAGGEKDA